MAIRKNLVLGGAGTIGTALCNYLKSINEEVISLDLKTGFDVRTDNLDAYKDVDYVWFLAWEVGGAKYLGNENYLLDIIRNNTTICEKVFQFLESTKLPFMFASSQLAGPDTPYGVTKLLGEEWSRILNGQICRFWNVYGWEEPGEKSHVIPDLIQQALINKKIELLTDGQEQRQFIYMDDCVENMIAIRNAGATRVDITNGNWVTIEQMASQIAALHNVPMKLGNKKGYSNKIEPISTYPLVFKTDFKTGIKNISEKSKKFFEEKNK
ncbi:NAD-dependent epimerase/dehydratase family protein [Aurantibacillus circumpalustris]|uniref:NAD-dependent epimerase/dehydratase family protein n=1 Tax=Aurantibacillus circumpalustris TaxID=3036359 RepID=UPI00295B2126|nr:NAD(P)-dependent oxidoreductase [Aurantibacillus circumpalustris]